MKVIIFTESENPELALEVYRLRYKIFTKKLHWFGENQEEVEKDQYDGLSRTFNLVIKDGDRIVGMARLIVGAPSLTEQLAKERFRDPKHLCISRVYFASKIDSKRVGYLMVKNMYEIGVKHDLHFGIACTYDSFLKNQFPFSLPFPIWKRMNVDGFPSVFLIFPRKAADHFVNIFNYLLEAWRENVKSRNKVSKV